MKEKELNAFEKSVYLIDMVEGFVNTGAMANPSYNELVPEQVRVIDDFVKSGESINLIGEWHDKDCKEFMSYPPHCIKDTLEANFIPEFLKYMDYINTRVYHKNSINGMLNDKLRQDIKNMKNLKEVVIMGVCEDLCVMDFVRTYARFMDEINRDVNIYVVGSCVDTFDSPYHNRQMWKDIARKVMEQAGAIYVNNYEDLKIKELRKGMR